MKLQKIVYMDYSATTKVHESVLNKFNYLCENIFANPNSEHELGKKANEIVIKSSENICSYFNINTNELIFTSGATESNNTILKGVKNGDKNQIITTKLEHESIYGTLGYLQKKGYIIDFVALNEDGTVNLKSLKSLLTKNTLLVTIVAVDSELGIRQPIEEIGYLLKKYPEVYFHSDITQCLGKEKIDLTNIDLASFSGHKIHCFKGIGGIIKKDNIKIQPLIYGGKSITKFRSGTSSTELIGSLDKAFDLFKNNLNYQVKTVTKFNEKIRKHVLKYPGIKINSTDKSIPNILNISILNKKSKDIQSYFEKNNIYLSTKTACASNTNLSKNVFLITNDENRASSSIRISLSYYTTVSEVDYFLNILDKFMENYDENY